MPSRGAKRPGRLLGRRHLSQTACFQISVAVVGVVSKWSELIPSAEPGRLFLRHLCTSRNSARCSVELRRGVTGGDSAHQGGQSTNEAEATNISQLAAGGDRLFGSPGVRVASRGGLIGPRRLFWMLAAARLTPRGRFDVRNEGL